MKLVQVGILVCLLAIVGLLGAVVVMNYQRSEAVAVAEETAPEDLALDAESAQPIPEPLEVGPPAKPASKPQPARTTTPPRRPPAPPKPVAHVDPPPAPKPVADPVPPKPVAPTTAPPVRPKPIEIAGHIQPEPAPKPAPPPVPREVTLPAGTEIPVRVDYALSSDRNFSGDTFTASLDRAIVIDNMVIAEKGARVEGRVVEAVRAGRVKGRAELSLELVRLDTADGQTVDLVSNRLHHEGKSSMKGDATKVGIGAGIGAAIGAIAGGGKGAAIGAGVGAGAGGGAAAATRGKPVEVPAEELLDFRLMEAVRIVENL